MAKYEPGLGEGQFREFPTEQESLKLMVDFVKSRGGQVRFDEYMAEHLFSETGKGYYSHRADIHPGGDFDTLASDPIFAKYFFDYLSRQGLTAKDQVFVELGGGHGQLKENLLAYAPNLKFLSVEGSPKLALEQKNINGRGGNAGTVMGDPSMALPFADRSFDGTIFSYEILDALPCRCFKLKTDNGVPAISEECFVVAEGDELKQNYSEADRGVFVRDYEKFLQQSGRNFYDGDVVSVSPQTKDLLKEMLRVLNKGKVLLFDYGLGVGGDGETIIQYMRDKGPFFHTSRGNGKINHMINSPYETDITYFVDFDYCIYLLKAMDEGIKAGYESREEFFAPLIGEPSADQFNDPATVELQNGSTFYVLKIEK